MEIKQLLTTYFQVKNEIIKYRWYMTCYSNTDFEQRVDTENVGQLVYFIQLFCITLIFCRFEVTYIPLTHIDFLLFLSFLAILGKSHYLLYGLVPAIQPRMLVTFDEKLNSLPVSVRVGQAVDVVGQAGKPKTITGEIIELIA